MNEPAGTSRRTSFAANLITPRTVLIFAAGFLLALFLARTLPDVGLFHPEGRVVTLDTVITGSTAAEAGGITAIGTRENKSFPVTDDVWDPELLVQVKERAPGPMSIRARIVYFIPQEGAENRRIDPPAGLMSMDLGDLRTPALIVDAAAFEHNLRTMSEALPGPRLRPHVKAHKCTALAARQADTGHRTFCCATIREMEGMAKAGLGEDLLLANEVLDARRLGALDARVTVAVDSEETVRAAADGGVREVLVDVNVGLPRCGVSPEEAGKIADLARSLGLEVRGVMGYEGHVVGLPDRSLREQLTKECMERLVSAHERVGGEIISAGGTGTYDINTWTTEIQAGSYVLMDTAYAHLDLPFRHALWILATVISVSAGHAVADAGLKSMGMDHGNPTIEGADVWYVADEHIVFAPSEPVRVGDRIRVLPAHIDPTIAYHERMHVCRGDAVEDVWEVDLRGW